MRLHEPWERNEATASPPQPSPRVEERGTEAVHGRSACPKQEEAPHDPSGANETAASSHVAAPGDGRAPAARSTMPPAGILPGLGEKRAADPFHAPGRFLLVLCERPRVWRNFSSSV